MFKGVNDWKKGKTSYNQRPRFQEKDTIALKKILQNFALNFPRIIGHIRS